MNSNRRAKIIIWLLWLVFVPSSTYLAFLVTKPDIASYSADILFFLILIAIVGFFPIKLNNTPIFLYEGIALAVFLSFGLFAELVFAQFAFMIVLLTIRIGWSELYRIPLNSLIFLITSIISAVVFYLLGGTHNGNDLASLAFLVPAAAYELTKFLSNQLVINFLLRLLNGDRIHFFTRDTLRQGITVLIQFPIGIILYILYTEMGVIATVYVGIPFITLSIFFKQYYASQNVNYYLQKASEIGHQLAGRLQVDEVLDLIIQKLSTVLPVDFAYILDVKKDGLHLIRYVENGVQKTLSIPPLQKNEGIGGTVWQTGQAVLFHKKEEWKKITQGYLPATVESIISVPIVRNKQIVGVLVLASNSKRSYEKYQLMIVDLLVSYLAVAVENARHYEETKNKSERCALTKLYNYRYFEGLLEEEFKKLDSTNKGEPLSLILLDIDHFKAVNDNFGHQSGNLILCELANRLVKMVGKRGTVARYGGEEFVILLPNKDKFTSLQIAEDIRKLIANNPFVFYSDLDNNRKQISAKITASIGVATALEDADDPLALVRHADRAMYTGAKQAGRNKVAQYVS
ncbi:diguanylate cyclase [Bacillus luteolus]|uniref:Diguanylate cyclase n=1 Tax=Litchfieldia luteola TaxID=682179 RepID=A0ABR9QI42_9BACI|nr:sensor domain-containing diguanylate cyclase [Cytobacillus luteolus]MBE4908164.1 diguanylate cyclase [Cytobacillus luteolus]MBP1942949.1 diguanylate cyclase (GGDEF)-like protein [Cytobacillus luteolus]